MLRVLDLFSGIGGFSLGLERTGGFRTVAFCEVDPYCRAVLRKHWPDVPIYEDVRELAGDATGPVDVICGGYPCQPFSHAGQRRGAEDDRHLWPEMYRLVAELRPAWVIGENVAGHISMGLDDVLSDLEGEGYACRTFVIPACAVGAPHRRDRCWTVAHADDERGHRRAAEPGPDGRAQSARNDHVAHAPQLQRNGSGEHPESRKRQVPESGERGSALTMADASRAGLEGRSQAGNAGGKRARGNEQLAGCCDLPRSAWLPEPDVGRVAARVSNRVDRLKALGNAVVPQIPEIIGHAILAAERG